MSGEPDDKMGDEYEEIREQVGQILVGVDAVVVFWLESTMGTICCVGGGGWEGAASQSAMNMRQWKDRQRGRGELRSSVPANQSTFMIVCSHSTPLTLHSHRIATSRSPTLPAS